MTGFRAVTLAVLCLAAAAPIQAGAATVATETVYQFAGVCRDCTGIGRGQLTLSNYTAGQQINSTNFSSFHYDGSNLIAAFTITNTGGSGYSGSLAAPFPSTNENVYFTDNRHYFFSNSGGWGLGQGSGLDDYGTNYTWSVAATSAVPEPASWALMVGGMGAVGYTLRRRRGTTARLAYAA